MAKAELEIKITDSGPSPVGRSAPGNSAQAWSQQISRPKLSATDNSQALAKTQEWQRLSESGDKISKAAKSFTDIFVKSTEDVGKAIQLASQSVGAKAAAATKASDPNASDEPLAKQLGWKSWQVAPKEVSAESAAAGVAEGGAAGGGIARLAAAAGPAAVAVAAVAGTVTVAVAGLKKFSAELDTNVATLRRMNGNVALAAARSDANMMLAELRRGNVIGEKLAAYETARSKLEIAAYEVWTKILDVLLNTFVPFMEFLVAVMQKLAEWLGTQKANVGGAANNVFAQQIFGLALQPLK